MKLFFQKVHCYLVGLSKVRLVVVFIVANLLNAFLFSKLSYFIRGYGLSNHSVNNMTLSNQFLAAVFLAPLLETLIFQYALIESIRQKIKPLPACLLSASAFALVHCYSVYYFLFAWTSGLIFAYLYYFEKSVIKSFLLVFLAHFLYNLLIYFSNFL